MNGPQVIQELCHKMDAAGGRHLYGVLGDYPALEKFAGQLAGLKTLDQHYTFPRPLNVNDGLLAAMSDKDFQRLARDEAKWPEPVAKEVERAFGRFLRQTLRDQGPVVLAHLEMVFAYNLGLSILRSLATDSNKVLLLLPGRRGAPGGGPTLFIEAGGGYTLPTNLIANDHLWELG